MSSENNNNTTWDSNSEDMEDEDLIMEETIEDEENDERYESRGKVVYPEDFGGSSSSHVLPRFNRNPNEFSRVDLSTAINSPIHEWGDAMDEKGESVALMMHLEKSIVHQKFFNNFEDDFDEDDLA